MKTRAPQHGKRSATAATIRRLSLVAALVTGGVPTLFAAGPESTSAVWSPYPSEEWTPRPSEPWSPISSEEWSPFASEPWSPRVALATRSMVEVGDATTAAEAGPSSSESEELPLFPAGDLFGAPPIGADTPFSIDATSGPATAAAAYGSLASCRPQSYFLPSLGRFGLVAPRMPGLDSVHSPYLIGPAPWGPPIESQALFPAPLLAANDFGLDLSPSCMDPRAQLAPYSSADFTADPVYDPFPYDPCAQQSVYGGKHLNPTQRPLIEWGMPLYLNGPVPPPSCEFGATNPSLPRFYLYGDYRAAAAYNDQGGHDQAVLANRINLEWDLWITATERFHMSTGPFQEGNDFMRVEFDEGGAQFENELDFFDEQTDALFFEGDLGYMLGGLRGTYAQFDLPISAGLMPLLFQNGVWMEDTILGVACAIPARNNPVLDWSNYDITFFAGFDQVTSPAFGNNNNAASVFGTTTYIEAKGGYIEAGYAYLDDTLNSNLSYHNVGLSYTRRYLNLVSNSMRVIVNAGQNGPESDRTADGCLVLAENSFLTPWPYNVIPYFNLFAGFDRPQSVARAGAAGGVLRNTGILFESDNLTGYPTLNATANDTYGGAVGLDLLAPDFSQQLILEAAVVQRMGDPPNAGAPDDQYGVGLRYQVPINNAHLLRFDVMHGWLDGGDNISGARAEYRWKF